MQPGRMPLLNSLCDAMTAVVVNLDVITVFDTALTSIFRVHLDGGFGIKLAKVGVIRPHGVNSEARSLRQQNELVLVPHRRTLVRLSRMEVSRKMLALDIEFLPHVELNGWLLDV